MRWDVRRAAILCLLLAGLVACGMPSLACAQNSGRTVRIIAPVPPGGTSDLVARVVAHVLKDAVGQPVVVENKPGATGRIAAMQVQEVREKFIAIGVEPTGTTPGAFATTIAADIARWAPIVKAASFTAE